MADTLKRYIHEDGHFKAAIIETTDVGRSAFSITQPSPIALQLVTQAMTGALLLCTGLKSRGTLMFKFQGHGPAEFMTVEANTAGQTRGFIMPSGLNFERKSDQGLFQQALGPGNITVRRLTESSGKTYTSVVPMVAGELAYNFANYLLESEQVPSAVQLGANLDPDHGVAGAGGVLIQAMPDADHNLLFLLESKLSDVKSLGEIFARGDGHAFIEEELFGPIPVKQLEETSVDFACSCTLKRVLQILSGMPQNELEDMLSEEKDFTITCNFCGKEYTCTPDDLRVMMELKQT